MQRAVSHVGAASCISECESLKLAPHLREQLVKASSSIALGSLRESQAILELAKVDRAQLLTDANQLGGMLYKMSRKPHQRSLIANTARLWCPRRCPTGCQGRCRLPAAGIRRAPAQRPNLPPGVLNRKVLVLANSPK